MSKRAWAYLWGVLLAGTVATGLALRGLAQSTSQWLIFTILTLAKTIDVRAPYVSDPPLK
jgi:hypothetical protein